MRKHQSGNMTNLWNNLESRIRYDSLVIGSETFPVDMSDMTEPLFCIIKNQIT